MVAGTVRRRGESWQAILNFRDPRQSGKVVQFTATRRTKREAEKALAELIVRRDREGLVRANPTFAQAVTKWREAKEHRRSLVAAALRNRGAEASAAAHR